MSRLNLVLGIVLAVLGLVLIVLSIVNPGLMQVYGVSLDVGALLLVGGVLSVGLSGVISAVERGGDAIVPMPAADKVPATVQANTQASSGFGRKGSEAAVAAATATLAAATAQQIASSSKSTVPSVAETISALEQAKSDIKTALGGMDVINHPSEEMAPVPDAAQHAPAEHAAAQPPAGEEGEGELYIVEEKIIRGRPARVLSDDTVEAETDEGWMRFENLEHLNEYLDSVEEGQA